MLVENTFLEFWRENTFLLRFWREMHFCGICEKSRFCFLVGNHILAVSEGNCVFGVLRGVTFLRFWRKMHFCGKPPFWSFCEKPRFKVLTGNYVFAVLSGTSFFWFWRETTILLFGRKCKLRELRTYVVRLARHDLERPTSSCSIFILFADLWSSLDPPFVSSLYFSRS